MGVLEGPPPCCVAVIVVVRSGVTVAEDCSVTRRLTSELSEPTGAQIAKSRHVTTDCSSTVRVRVRLLRLYLYLFSGSPSCVLVLACMAIV
jgi:hypothetical protein